ncbi:MAG TPA: helix-turn-helix domain-containing protein, partial [Acidimicrobiales bacterium]|nr:helix-turn-helix domain-containing protein [Acidimicrobiales bacterium]
MTGGARTGQPVSTPDRLLRAAERLFAERGVDAVSLREITRESGARNAIALQYHFTDRAGVVAAIAAKHEPGIEAARRALLDEYEAGPDAGVELRPLAAALVRPLAAKLSDPDGGPEYLRIQADLLSRPRPALGDRWMTDPTNSMFRWRALVDPFLAEEAVRLHRRFTAVVHTAVELGRRAAGGPHADDRLFVSHLTDVVTAILGGPVSDETRRLIGAR